MDIFDIARGIIAETPTECCGAGHKGSANSLTDLVCRNCYRPINADGTLVSERLCYGCFEPMPGEHSVGCPTGQNGTPNYN